MSVRVVVVGSRGWSCAMGLIKAVPREMWPYFGSWASFLPPTSSSSSFGSHETGFRRRWDPNHLHSLHPWIHGRCLSSESRTFGRSSVSHRIAVKRQLWDTNWVGAALDFLPRDVHPPRMRLDSADQRGLNPECEPQRILVEGSMIGL